MSVHLHHRTVLFHLRSSFLILSPENFRGFHNINFDILKKGAHRCQLRVFIQFLKNKLFPSTEETAYRSYSSRLLCLVYISQAFYSTNSAFHSNREFVSIQRLMLLRISFLSICLTSVIPYHYVGLERAGVTDKHNFVR